MSPPPGDLAALREATLEQARAALAEAVTPDRGLLQGVRALDEALEVANRLAERLARWAAEATGAARQPPSSSMQSTSPISEGQSAKTLRRSEASKKYASFSALFMSTAG